MGSPVGILALGQHGSSCPSKYVRVCVCVRAHVHPCVHVYARGGDGGMCSYFLLRFYGALHAI